MSTRSPPTSDAGRRLVDAIATAGTDREISLALVSAVDEEPHTKWLYDRCLELAKRGSWKLTATAATCIGNLARIRGYVRADMIPVLESLATGDARVRLFVEDAIANVQNALEHPQPGDVHE